MSERRPQNSSEMAEYLVEQLKVGLFPPGKVGERALVLWGRIRRPLLRGDTVEITRRALGLRWHRQQLKRARDAISAINLIRPTGDGRFRLGRYDAVEEAVRQEMHFLRGAEVLCKMIARLGA